MSVVVVLLTAVLVAVTTYYAYQTRETVSELRRARGVAVLPRLMLTIEVLGGGAGVVVLTNAGVGPAIDVSVTMDYGPGQAQVPWETPLLVQGARERFLPPGNETWLDTLAERYPRIALRGRCIDALGSEYIVKDELRLETWWEINKGAMHLGDEDHLKSIVDKLDAIAAEIKRANP